jgi:hypothetical protein
MIQTTPGWEAHCERLRIATGRETHADVLRDALEFYDSAVLRMIRGKRLFHGDVRETAEEIKLPHVDRSATRQYIESFEAIAEAQLPQPAGPQAEGASHPYAATLKMMRARVNLLWIVAFLLAVLIGVHVLL